MAAERIEVDERFTVEMSPPTRERVEALAMEGFRSLVNLRTAEEPGQVLSPDEEGEVARRHGLEYLHVPVLLANLSGELAETFNQEMARLSGPALVHCASGRRAGLLTLMHLARAEGLSSNEAIARAERLGFDVNDQARSLFQQYVGGER